MAGDPIAPAEISPGVPNDLDTLCTVTLGPNDDGPHSPAELVRELEPWGTITAIEPATARAGRPSRVVDTAVDVPLPGPHDAPADGAAAQGEQPDGVVGAQGLGTGPDTHRGSAPDAPVVAPRGRGAPPPAIPPTLRRGDPRVTAASAGGGGITVPAPSAGGAGAAAPVAVPAAPVRGAPRSDGCGAPTSPPARPTGQDLGVRALRRCPPGSATCYPTGPARSARGVPLVRRGARSVSGRARAQAVQPDTPGPCPRRDPHRDRHRMGLEGAHQAGSADRWNRRVRQPGRHLSDAVHLDDRFAVGERHAVSDARPTYPPRHR